MRARTNRSAALPAAACVPVPTGRAALPAAACVPVPTGRLHCLLLHAWLYQQVGCVSCCYMRARAVGLCSSKNVQVQARLQLKHHMDLELLPFQLISHYACVALILRLLCCAGAHQAEAHGAGSAAEGDLGGGHGRAQRVGCGGGVALMAATGGWRGVVTDRLVGAAWALGPLGPCGPPSCVAGRSAAFKLAWFASRLQKPWQSTKSWTAHPSAGKAYPSGAPLAGQAAQRAAGPGAGGRAPGGGCWRPGPVRLLRRCQRAHPPPSTPPSPLPPRLSLHPYDLSPSYGNVFNKFFGERSDFSLNNWVQRCERKACAHSTPSLRGHLGKSSFVHPSCPRRSATF